MSDLKELYEGHFRGANYLLAAHSVGLVGCISALKDYNSTPQLRGVGIFVVLFGIGLLAAIGNYVALVLSQATAKREYPDEDTVKFLLKWHIWAVGIALAALVVAIIIIIFRFASL